MKRSLPRLPVLTVVPSLLIAAGLFGFSSPSLPAADAKAGISQTPKTFDSELPRHPVDLAFLMQGQRIVTANQGLGTLSLIDRQSGAVLHEVYCGQRPTAVVAFPDQSQLLAVCSESGSVNQWRLDHDRLVHVRDFEVGFEPIGITVDSRGQFAYVATQLNGRVVELDLNKGMRVREFAVGPWPRYLSLSPDGKRLTVGCSGDGKAYVLDVQGANASPNDPKSDGPEPLLPLYDVPLSGGINLGHFVCSADNTYAYFPAMIYRSNPINVSNIRRGWVLASRLVRVRLDGEAVREAISLDVPSFAVADPHGIALSPNQERIVVTASGTHELLVYRVGDLPFVGAGGPGDLIDRRLINDTDLFYRIRLDGRPMGVIMDQDQLAYVANDTRNSIQVVDLKKQRVVQEFELGGDYPAGGQLAQAELGRQIFYDGRRSLDQWYSCHTCHYNGGINNRAMDTLNDGSPLTMKTVLPLQEVHETGPWTWHGWQTDLDASLQKSFTETMQGSPASTEDVAALSAYFKQLKLPKNPHTNPKPEADPEFFAAVERGAKLFASERAACSQCHTGDQFTDGEIHDVGLGSPSDRYEGYNTPSLRGAIRKVRFLHDGRAKTLESVLTDYHTFEKFNAGEKLSSDDVRDLIAYLKTL